MFEIWSANSVIFLKNTRTESKKPMITDVDLSCPELRSSIIVWDLSFGI